jgi:hypothetical protein
VYGSNYFSPISITTKLAIFLSEMVNFNNDIPFIRTLFKTGYHYEYQLVKREDLQFIIDKNGMILDYFECDF